MTFLAIAVNAVSYLNEGGTVLMVYCRITAVCGAYYIGGREFDSLSDLIGYYTSYSDLLKGERLQTPVPPPEVCKPLFSVHVLLSLWNDIGTV